MSYEKDKKKAVRLRMERTGEKYTQALRYLTEHPDELAALMEERINDRQDRRERRTPGAPVE